MSLIGQMYGCYIVQWSNIGSSDKWAASWRDESATEEPVCVYTDERGKLNIPCLKYKNPLGIKRTP